MMVNPLRRYALGFAVVAALAASLFSGCGETGEEASETDETETPVGEATGIETRTVPKAGVDITWEEWAPYGRAHLDLDWVSGVVWAGGRICAVGTRAQGEVVENNTKDKKPCDLVVLSLSRGGVAEAGSTSSRFYERVHIAVATDGRYIYCAGGAYTPKTILLVPDGEFEFAPLSASTLDFNRYNIATESFDEVTTLPTARAGAVATVQDGLLYVAGGIFDKNDPQDEINRQFDRYDPAADRWTKLTHLRIPLYRPQMSVYGTQVYFFGGLTYQPERVTNFTMRYDLEVFKWQQKNPTPVPREGGRAFVVGDKIYLLGGRESYGFDQPDRMNRCIHEYDPDEDEWAELPTRLPEGSDLVCYDGVFFYCVGREVTYRGRLADIE
ncbi:MAG: hypothetical protein JSW52_11485 [Candidatus Coatesbacteria bacterium]|nr:MAG: hypothetical protein JSW52_11485 [Candidatus Coatesbacteria bacterium]